MVQHPVQFHAAVAGRTPTKRLRSIAVEYDNPRYAPGDRVVLTDPSLGLRNVPGEVVRIVTIAQQPHQSARYLYALRLEHDIPNVFVADDVLAPLEASV